MGNNVNCKKAKAKERNKMSEKCQGEKCGKKNIKQGKRQDGSIIVPVPMQIMMIFAHYCLFTDDSIFFRAVILRYIVLNGSQECRNIDNSYSSLVPR